jgi:hypothetical protein
VATLRSRLLGALRDHPERGVAALLAAGVGALVFFLAVDLFPYHSVNDDEGVYLYQAAMLLEGDLFLHPRGYPLEAVRPWFFVVDETAAGPRMYSKYSPVAPAMFAVGRLLGDWNLALGLVAAGSAALVYVLGSAAFDRRVGLVAVVALAASPLFLLTSSVFLAYAPTTFLNLCFAAAYVRAARTGSRRWAAAAGSAIGLAFFARPYTAVLFAAPFAVHGLFVLVSAWREDGGLARGAGRFGGVAALGPSLRRAVGRYAAVSVPGLAFVCVTLGYNAVVTGDPLVFPYAAFAPGDGLGFGHHELLGYEETFTPALAVETTVTVGRYFFTEWTPAGVVGTALAAVGAGAAAWRRRGRLTRVRASVDGMGDGEVATVLAGVVPAVFLGETYFWGTLNGLRNGLVDLLGPYYHFDALVPVAVFAAAGAVAIVRRTYVAVAARTTRRRARLTIVALLVVSAPVVAVAEASVVADPVSENRERTANLGATYEPFEERRFEDAVVFTPDPYGDWQAHPFQYLRSDPGFDGRVVYVTEGPPPRTLAVLDATNRTPYRFTYRGEWAGAVRPVTPHLERLEVLGGERVRATSTFGVPTGSQSASVRVETATGYARYAVPAAARTNGTVTVEWVVGPDGVRATNLRYLAGSGENRSAPLPEGEAAVDLAATFVGRGGASVTYRQTATVGNAGTAVRVVWPPETRVCRLTTDCGREGTWVGPDGDYVGGVSVTTDAGATSETATDAAVANATPADEPAARVEATEDRAANATAA